MTNKLLTFIISLLILSCTVKVSTESDLEQLNQTIDDFNEAFKVCDIAILDQLTTADYSHTNSGRPAIKKQAWMDYLSRRKAMLSTGHLKVTKYQMDERQVIMYNNSAWVTGVIIMDANRDSLSYSRKIRVSNFWIKEDKQWKRAGFHDTHME